MHSLTRVPTEVWDLILKHIPHTESHRLMFIFGKFSYNVIRKAFFRTKGSYLCCLVNPDTHRVSAELGNFIRSFHHLVTNQSAKCYVSIEIEKVSSAPDVLKALNKAKFLGQRALTYFSGLSIRIGANHAAKTSPFDQNEPVNSQMLSDRLSALVTGLSLEHLHLAVTSATLPSAFAACLTTLTALCSLDLSGTACSNELCQALSETMRRLPRLRAISACGSGITAAGLTALSAALTPLVALRLNDNPGVGELGLLALHAAAAAAPCASGLPLAALSIARTAAAGDAPPHDAALPQLVRSLGASAPRLTDLDLSGLPAGDAALAALADALRTAPLRALALAHVHAGPAGAAALAPLLAAARRTLCRLDLSSNPIGGAGAGAVLAALTPAAAAAARRDCLCVSLRHTGLDSDGAAAAAAALSRWPRAGDRRGGGVWAEGGRGGGVWLDAGRNPVGRRGAEALLACGGDGGPLRGLGLRDCQVRERERKG